MRNVLLKTLSLALFALVVSHSSSAIAQRRTCDLRLRVVEMNTGEIDELKPINGARVVATKTGSRRTIPAVMLDGQPEFPKLTDGEYRITITKRGFKRTVQRITFVCVTPNRGALTHVRLEHGSPTLTVVNEKQTVRAGVVRGVSVVGTTISPPQNTETESPAIVEKPPSRSKIVSGGVLNGRAISLPRPEYPAVARAAKASGTVTVQVTIDEEGNVISAAVVSGHPLLREATLEAARAAKFSTTTLSGQPVKVTGVINYNFGLN